MENSSQSMHVLMVTKGLDIGGIERIVVDLALGLRRRGVSVDVAVVNDRRDQLIDQLENSGVAVHRLGGSDHIGVGAGVRLARLARDRRFDVVHVHGPLPAVLVRCIPNARPIVTTSHTAWRGLRPATRALWRATAFRDESTLAVSSAVAESLPSRGRGRTTLMPHGIDIDAIDAAEASAVPSAGGYVTAICVASHRDVKNYPGLLHALATARRRVPELRLVAVGDGPDRPRHELLAKELGLDDAVSFQTATTDVLQVMASADLLVVSSDFEGQPIVVMEAMALGLPIVATAVGRVPELVTPAEGLIVAPGDHDALAAALVEIASNSDTRRAMGQNARSASRSWTLEQVLDAHLDLYSSLSC